MRALRALPLPAVLAALIAVSFAAAPVARAAPQQEPAASPPPTAAAPPTAPVPQGPPKVCLDVPTKDSLTRAFAQRLAQAIGATGSLTVALAGDPCDLQLHVPGNLLRFETAGGVMVSTVVIVTSPSGRYLSTSVAACQEKDLGPCALRAVAAAKLAIVERSGGGT